MRYASTGAYLLLMVVSVCLSVGCGDDSTAPENGNPPPSNELSHSWSQRFGDSNEQSGFDVAIDGSGNTIVVGHFWGTVNFGGGPLSSAGAEDIFVAKFGPDGTHVWSKRFGATFSQEAFCVAVDATGNVIISGRFNGSVDFGGGVLTSAGSSDVFVAKFGADGTHMWSDRFGNNVIQEGWGVAADATGNLFVAGRFYGTVNFGGGDLASAGNDDIFVAKFNASGTHLWSERFGDSSTQSARDIAVDGSGNVMITGDLYGTVDFGGGGLTSAGSNDVFAAKFNADGGHLWSKRFGDAEEQSGRSIATDASGNVIVAGDFQSSVDFGGGALTSAGRHDVFVAKLAPHGGHVWSKRFGDGTDQEIYCVSTDAAGKVCLAGHFGGTMEFGGDPLTSAGSFDIFVATFSATGAHYWSSSFGDGNEQYVFGGAAGASGDVIITGELYGTVDFGGGDLTSAGTRDVFVAKFEP
jgi:hypothetical protein